MKILVVNSGSSSVKYRVFDVDGANQELTGGMVERIGGTNADLKCSCCFPGDSRCAARLFGEPGKLNVPDHRRAIAMIFELLQSDHCMPVKGVGDIAGIGHRVVHGGEEFSESMLIDDEVIAGIERCARLAPLHNPPALSGIRACAESFGGTPQVAVFDTAFHRTIPEKAYRYGVPEALYRDYGIRKYGFHGTSHRYASHEAAKVLKTPIERTKMVSCHLGNGSSITAVQNGESIDTTMGLTPLAGVIMGTRPGDLDPFIPLFMIREMGMTVDEVDDTLNKRSGFEGICRHHDVREIEELARAGDDDCQLALDMFAYRVARFIGGSIMALSGCDAIVFTGGIGQNDPYMRARILRYATHLGIKVDPARNSRNERVVSTDDSRVKAIVVPANEELVIAQDTAHLICPARKRDPRSYEQALNRSQAEIT